MRITFAPGARIVVVKFYLCGAVWRVLEVGFQRRPPGRERKVLASEELVDGGHAGGSDASEHLDLPVQH